MKGSMKIISVKGIKLYVHWTFLFLVGWIVLVNTRTGDDLQQLIWSLVFLFAVFACVALHEFGHALMAARFGIKARNIILLPIGGIASIEKFPDNPRQELSISIAGPLVNIFIAAVLALFLFPLPGYLQDPSSIRITHGHDLLYNLFVVNIALALFNLIPAFPMDGGRILRALLGFRINYVRATTIAAFIGKIIAVLFIITGIVFYNLILSLIGVFIIFSASTEEYYLRLKALVKGIRFKELLMYDYNSIQTKTTIKEAGGILMNNHNKYFIVMDGAIPVGTVNRMDIIKAIAEMKYEEPVQKLMKENLSSFDADTQVETALEEMAANPERIHPVMESGQFLGVVNFNHIIEYLLINKAGSGEFARIKSLAGLV
jgi:Zn-dependent protease/predicted transcriptional regulator